MIKHIIRQLPLKSSYMQAKLVKFNKGSALIEVLISLVIIALAVLSHTHLVSNGMKISTETAQITQADILSRDIIEQILINPDESALSIYTQGGSITEGKHCSNFTVSCDPAELAQASLFEWRGKMAQIFPAGSPRLEINIDPIASIPRFVTVTIFWNPDGSSDRIKTDCQFGDDRLMCQRVKSAL